MGKRRWVAAAVGVFLLGLLAALWRTLPPGGLTDPAAASITRANFDRLAEGTSADEVNQILGVPPGDYRRKAGFRLVGPGHIPWTERARGGRLEIWYVPRAHVEVLFDKDGHVVGKYWHEDARP